MFERDPKLTRLAKYSILLSIKETYLFARNWLGLFLHPLKTIRSLFRERDYSQIILIFATPIYIFVGGLFSIWFARRFFQIQPGNWGFKTKAGIGGISILSFIIFIYLGFWLLKVIKINKKEF